MLSCSTSSIGTEIRPMPIAAGLATRSPLRIAAVAYLPYFLVALPIDGPALEKILRVHDRPQRDLCVEGEKPRLSDRWNLRCVFHVENDRARSLAAVVRKK